MRFVERAVITLFSVIALAALVQLSIHVFDANGWKPMTPGDWGVWVGAIGTVLAFFGTIWLATEDRRRRRDAEFSLAMITSAKFIRAVPEVIELLEEMLDVLADSEDVNLGYLCSSFADTLENRPRWTREDLIAIIPLPNRAAEKLSLADVDLDGLAKYLAAHADKHLLKQHFDQAQLDDELRSSIAILIEYLHSGYMECLELAEWLN